MERCLCGREFEAAEGKSIGVTKTRLACPKCAEMFDDLLTRVSGRIDKNIARRATGNRLPYRDQ